MSGPCARAGPDKQLMGLSDGDDLVHERVQGRATAVDDALPADLDHRRVRQDPEVLRRLRRLQKPCVGQRTLHEERLELRRRIGHGNTFRRFQELFILSSNVIHLMELPHNSRNSCILFFTRKE